MSDTANASSPLQCPYCGSPHTARSCPRVKAIDYFPNGSIKRVEFHGPAPSINYPAPTWHFPVPFPPIT